jgi:predicted DNA-binding protein
MLQPVTFKIDKETAEKLERKAKEVPKRTVSSYVRALVEKALRK